MRLSTVAFLMILTTLALSGCTQEVAVAVEDKGSMRFSQSMPNKLAYVPLVPSQPVMDSVVESKDIEAPARTVGASGTTSNKVTYTPVASSRWQWPVKGHVTQNFSPSVDGIGSNGVVIAAAEGAPIHAAQAGEVAFVGQNVRDYGNMVVVRHAQGLLSAYSHARLIAVSKGEKVVAGQVLGYVGTSGGVKTPQLHFAVREGAKAIDPLSKLPQDVAVN